MSKTIDHLARIQETDWSKLNDQEKLASTLAQLKRAKQAQTSQKKRIDALLKKDKEQKKELKKQADDLQKQNDKLASMQKRITDSNNKLKAAQQKLKKALRK